MSEEATATAVDDGQATQSDGSSVTDSSQMQEVTWENSPIAKVYNPDGTPRSDAAKALEELGHSDIAGHALRNGQPLFTALKTGKDAAAFASQKQEGMIKMPGEDATDDQRAEFHKALGAIPSKEDALANLWPENLPEGYVKDEALADLLADHAAKHPVNTPESIKELVAGYDQLNQARQEEAQKQHFEEAQKLAESTKNTLTQEFGGTQAYSQFSAAAQDFTQSEAFKEFGFEFYKTDDGKLTSDNPIHASMMSDPAALRWLKATMEQNSPAKLPLGNPSPVSAEDQNAAAAKFYAENNGPGGWKSEAAMRKYYEMKGISR